jgi:hypothetical protein
MPGNTLISLHMHGDELTREGMNSLIDPLDILSHPNKIVIQLQL